MKNNWSAFCSWAHQIWLQNCDEHDESHELRYTQQEYFKMYKYWLKREYKHQSKV